MMKDGLRSFVLKFADLSGERIRAGRRCVESDGGDLQVVAREMHSMAGEAGLLGMVEVMAFARAAEQAAHALASTPSAEQRDAMIAALDDVETALRNATRGLRAASPS
jgi:HPt (histidine-containing phosphotransfer) domain-containing protein